MDFDNHFKLWVNYNGVILNLKNAIEIYMENFPEDPTYRSSYINYDLGLYAIHISFLYTGYMNAPFEKMMQFKTAEERKYVWDQLVERINPSYFNGTVTDPDNDFILVTNPKISNPDIAVRIINTTYINAIYMDPVKDGDSLEIEVCFTFVNGKGLVVPIDYDKDKYETIEKQMEAINWSTLHVMLGYPDIIKDLKPKSN